METTLNLLLDAVMTSLENKMARIHTENFIRLVQDMIKFRIFLASCTILGFLYVLSFVSDWTRKDDWVF